MERPLIKHVVRGTPFPMPAIIKSRPRQVASLNLWRSEPDELTAFSFDAGEGISKEVLDEDRLYIVIDGEMVIELYTSDQLVPTSELFRAVQNGTIDAVQCDEDSMSSPADVAIFGAYFPFATRYSLDVPALFEHWGLNDIWKEAYGEIKGVEWLGAGSWDPCNFATTKPIRSLADLKGKRVFSFPTGGKFKPFVGVGINYTTFFEEETSLGELKIDDSWGLAATIGADYALSDKRALRAELRYIDIDADVYLNGGYIGTAEIDPLVANVAYVVKF